MLRALRRTPLWAAALLLAVMTGPALTAERRVALVVGNNAYRAVPALQKAVNDARAVAERLKAIGFEVIARENLDRRGTNQALNDFTARLDGAEVALFYYAGHGVQLEGRNILLPVDVPRPKTPDELVDEGVDLGRVLERLADSRVRFVSLIIDACRDNPFPKQGTRSIGGTRGLTIPAAPNGVYIVYSAGVNEQALDNLGPADRNPNSIFTRNLLPELGKPGLSFDGMIKQTRERVRKQAATVGHQQNPAIYDQTTGDFYFQGPETVAAVPPRDEPAAPAAASAPDKEMLFWEAIKDSTDAGAFEAYLRQYPKGSFAELARFKINSLKRATAAPRTAVAPPPSPPPAPRAQPAPPVVAYAPVAPYAPPETPPPPAYAPAVPPAYAPAAPAPVDRSQLLNAIETYYAGQKVYEQGRLAKKIEYVRNLEIVSQTEGEIQVRLQFDAEPLFLDRRAVWDSLKANRTFRVRRDGQGYTVTGMQ